MIKKPGLVGGIIKPYPTTCICVEISPFGCGKVCKYGPCRQSYGFSRSYGWCESHKEDWAPENWCSWTVVLEKILQSPLDCKEIQPVHPKGDQSWIFIERTDADTEMLILWPPDVKNWLTRKDPDAGKDWRQEEKGQQRMRWLDGIIDSMDMSLGKL